jgi:hypothetical protein
MVADASDDPADLVTYCRILLQGYDCVSGSRFVPGAKVVDYPSHKLLLSWLANWFHRAAVLPAPERHHQRLQVPPPGGDRRCWPFLGRDFTSR